MAIPLRVILLSGWCLCLIYANLYARFMQMLWFCLNQCVLSEMKDSIKLTVSVQSCSVFVSHPHSVS